MALFKIEKGLAANLATNRPDTVEGYCYVTTDDGKFYIDIKKGTSTANDSAYRIVLNAGAADKLTNARSINGTLFDGTSDITTSKWGTSRNFYIRDADSTNTGVAVSVDGSTGEYLKLPATIKATLTGNADTATILQTARTINGMTFDGSANINNYGVCDTAANTAAKTVTVGSTFVLEAGAQVTIKFTYSNSSSAPTLDVNGTGAKSIYKYGTTSIGAYSTITDGGWSAGAVIKFTYDGNGWVRDYWCNSDKKMLYYVTTTNAEYPLLATYTANATTSVYSYGRYSTGISLNPSTNNITATSFTGSLFGNADTATKLTTARTFTIGNTGKDFDGSAAMTWSHTEIGATVSNTITTATTTGPKLTTTVNGVAGTAVTIPAASSSQSGVITTGTQSLAGAKTWSGAATFSNTLTAKSTLTVTSTATFNGSVNIAGGALTTKAGVEIFHATPYIDFHFNNSTDDYTSRIIETSAGVLSSTAKFYGAVWNDYAEFRKFRDDDEIPYGRIVIENGDDSLSLSTARLQKGGNVCSDTFGFAIGETKENQMPIAVAGRALVYTYEDRYSYEPGDAVCTGPNGTISKMTQEEIQKYPDRIIGYVSAIPEYEIWGEKNTIVNKRIWIKVV